MCGIIPSSTSIKKVQVTSLIPQTPAPFKLSPIHIFYMIIEDENTVLRTDNVKCACCFILQLYKPQHKILNNKLNKLLCYIIS